MKLHSRQLHSKPTTCRSSLSLRAPPHDIQLPRPRIRHQRTEPNNKLLHPLTTSILYCNNVRNHNRSAFLWAAEKGSINTLKQNFIHGADVSEGDDVDVPSLILAAKYGHIEAADFLLQHNADFDAVGLCPKYTGGPPLLEAASKGQTDMVRLLLDRGADINRLRGGDYVHALEAVICEDRTDTVHLLLDNGASVKLPGDWDTPLLAAVYVGMWMWFLGC